MSTPTAPTLEPVATIESTTSVDEHTIRYWEAGSGRPIVFLHRGRGPRWSRTHDLLSENHRVIMLELPGFGLSEPWKGTSTKEYAAIVHRAATQIAGSAYDLVGNSFGGLIAAWVTVQFPSDIESLVLISPAIYMPAGIQMDVSEENFDIIDALEAEHPERHYPQPLDTATKFKQMELLGRLLVAEDPELLAGLTDSTVPTLVVFGTEDKIIPPELGKKYPALNGAFFLSFVYDAGHAVDGDRPESLAHTIERFTQYKIDFLIERGRTLLFP